MLAGKRIGLFVSGFWFSGSGAVVDWLLDHSRFIQPPGSEIKALGRGIHPLVEIAAGRRWYGEWIGRCSLYPDRSRWGDLFGPSLIRGSPPRRWTGRFVDRSHATLTRLGGSKRVRRFESKLLRLLRQDYRVDREYWERVKGIMDELRPFQATGEGDPFQDEGVQAAVSSLMAYLYDLWAQDGKIPVFNNAVSGKQSEFFSLLDESIFPTQVALLVQRDPRDQFLEITDDIGMNPRNPLVVRWFIRNYKQDLERLESLPERVEESVRVIRFEDFVTDRHGVRTETRKIVEEVLRETGRQGEWEPASFDPSRSEKNIGKWKKARLDRPMRKICDEISGSLHPLCE